MKKRKRREGQLVQLKIRIRERLRQRLEYAAREQEIPLSHEIVRRLENSFEKEQLLVLLKYMLAPGMSMDLFKALAGILAEYGLNWQKGPYRHLVATAIYKVIAIYIGELSQTSLPERDKPGSADQIAWDALFELRRQLPPKPVATEQQLRQRQELRQIEDEKRFMALAPRTPQAPPDEEPELPLPVRGRRRPLPPRAADVEQPPDKEPTLDERLRLRAQELAAEGRTKDAAMALFMVGRPLPRPLPPYLLDLLDQELLDLLDQEPELFQPPRRSKGGKS